MQDEKERLLNEAYQHFIQFGFGNLPVELSANFVAEDIMSYGTAIDEKVFSRHAMDEWIISQREQSEGLDVQLSEIPVSRRISAQEDTATIVSEFIVSMKVEGNRHELFMRLTTVMEFIDGKWLAVHTHASNPDSNSSKSDPLHINEWKRKNEELQKLVEQKTADLENKNKELVIESSLERVRARAMAMQHSDELAELVSIVFNELKRLDFPVTSCIIWISNPELSTEELWVANAEMNKPPRAYFINPFRHSFFKSIIHAWKERDRKWIYELSGKEKEEFQAEFFKDVSILPDVLKRTLEEPEKVVFSASFSSFGALEIVGNEPIADEKFEMLHRFGKVFDLSYTRFNDIKKAEAQAREAEIELSLERVRARTMAMQKSDELPEAANLLFKQVQSLGMPAWSAGYCTWDEDKKGITLWMSSEGVLQPPFRAPVNEDPSFIHFYDAYQRGETFYVEEIGGDALVAHYRYMRTLPVVGEILDSIIATGHPLPGFQIFHCAYFLQGFLLFITYEPVPDAHIIFKRFAGVFEQTYTRFLDLKKAEAQAREANIELGLERVRTRAMAMRNSEDLNEMIGILFGEMTKLDLVLTRCIILIFEPETNGSRWYMANAEDPSNPNSYYVKNHESPPYQAFIHAWKERKYRWQYSLEGKEKVEWDNFIFNETELTRLPEPVKDGMRAPERILLSASFNNFGCLNVASLEPLSDEHSDILLRFAKVFDLTYTRFNDIKKAEAQTQKANIEVALERVRARALAMQEPEELIEVAQVLRQEMGLLGVEELETSSIYIHDENSDTVECWYAITDLRHPEKKLVADQITIDLQKTWVGRQMIDFYQSDKAQISILMQGGNRIEWIKYCASVSTVFGDFYGETIPDRTYHLYKFSNGAIGAASAGDISSESWELLSRTASVFSLAYSRFKDLTKARIDLQRLKEEKQRAETALAELTATQTQLVQAEKMASLGELTAGIAHEIQNPLNFVNNFSEVNAELSDEIMEAVKKGDLEEILLLAKDIRDNQEKISEHGKRADSIVKGMLQHSRSSSGANEPTDINKLADEYLRLAYHGLRAKDKSFNADMKTDFDENIGNINIIPQDIGRVLLNMINNAFYAVNERSKEEVKGYEPVVSISTCLLPANEDSLIRQSTNSIIITVKDNGNGIPQKILDKIFQPFFTTKPTGQGTGLGLSLSYDIVKAHGGEIKVSTTESEGTEFTIQLPANKNA